MKLLLNIKPPIKKIRDKENSQRNVSRQFSLWVIVWGGGGGGGGGGGKFPGSTFPAGQISRGNIFGGFFLEPV